MQKSTTYMHTKTHTHAHMPPPATFRVRMVVFSDKKAKNSSVRPLSCLPNRLQSGAVTRTRSPTSAVSNHSQGDCGGEAEKAREREREREGGREGTPHWPHSFPARLAALATTHKIAPQIPLWQRGRLQGATCDDSIARSGTRCERGVIVKSNVSDRRGGARATERSH